MKMRTFDSIQYIYITLLSAACAFQCFAAESQQIILEDATIIREIYYDEEAQAESLRRRFKASGSGVSISKLEHSTAQLVETPQAIAEMNRAVISAIEAQREIDFHWDPTNHAVRVEYENFDLVVMSTELEAPDDRKNNFD